MEGRATFRSILLAKGSPFIAQMSSLIMILVFFLFPWVTASEGGYITFWDHYMYYTVTARLIQLLLIWKVSEAAVFFLIGLIALPPAMLLTFLNRPVLSGILLVVTGLSFIFLFIVAVPTLAMESVMGTWEHSVFPFTPRNFHFGGPYNVGIGTYVLVIIGGYLIFSGYCYQRSLRQKRKEFLSYLDERSR